MKLQYANLSTTILRELKFRNFQQAEYYTYHNFLDSWNNQFVKRWVYCEYTLKSSVYMFVAIDDKKF